MCRCGLRIPSAHNVKPNFCFFVDCYCCCSIAFRQAGTKVDCILLSIALPSSHNCTKPLVSCRNELFLNFNFHYVFCQSVWTFISRFVYRQIVERNEETFADCFIVFQLLWENNWVLVNLKIENKIEFLFWKLLLNIRLVIKFLQLRFLSHSFEFVKT